MILLAGFILNWELARWISAENWLTGRNPTPLGLRDELGPSPKAWACARPGSQAVVGVAGNLGGADITFEGGVLSGRSALGTRPWNLGATGFLPEAELSAGPTKAYLALGSQVRLTLGRTIPYENPLALWGRSLDGVVLEAAGEGIRARWGLWGLDTYIADTASWFKEGWLSPGDRVRRFLIFKGLELWGDGWSVCAGEATVYSTKGTLPSFGALNPVLPAYIHQWIAGDECNPVWLFGASLRSGGWGLLAYLMIDDFQFNPNYWDSIPPDVGARVEVWASLSGGTGRLVVEAITPWAFNNKKPWDKFLAWGSPLSQAEKPDQVRVAGAWLWGEGWRWGPEAELRVLGSGCALCPDPYPDYPSEIMLVPPTSSRITLGLRALKVSDRWFLDVIFSSLPGIKMGGGVWF